MKDNAIIEIGIGVFFFIAGVSLILSGGRTDGFVGMVGGIVILAIGYLTFKVGELFDEIKK